MRVRDPEETLSALPPIHNNVLRPLYLLSITNDNDSYLIHSGFREVVATPVTILIKVKRYHALLIRRHGGDCVKSLLIQLYSRVKLVKDALKYCQGLTMKKISGIVLGMPSHAIIQF